MEHRQKAFTQKSVTSSLNAVMLFPPNPLRCGLYIIPVETVGVALVSLNGTDADINNAPYNGIVISTTAPLHLTENEVAGCITGPVSVASSQSPGHIIGIEWFYVG